MSKSGSLASARHSVLNRVVWIFYPALLIAVFLARHNPFFWDTVQLASRHAHHYYETGFSTFLLPTEIDSGHPPFFGMYIAVCWQLFGKTLPVSHFAMLPFVMGLLFIISKIGKYLGGQKAAYGLTLLVLADPVMVSQLLLVSPDIVLACFFLLAVWVLLENKSPWLLAASVSGLALISMRGMMVAAGLFLFSVVLRNEGENKIVVFRKLIPFLPGAMLGAGFLIFHYIKTGWIGYHAGSVWAPSFAVVDLYGLVKNIAVLGWRMLDFGRLFVWVALLLLLFFKIKRRKGEFGSIFSRKSVFGKLIILLLLISLALIPTQLLYKGLLAHRYLLPIFLLLSLLFFYALQQSELSRKWRGSLFAIAFFGLLSGNFWIYPNNISIGWDSTLAHLPWYKLQNEMDAYLLSEGIKMQETGTAFPNIGPRKYFLLNGEESGFIEKDLAAQCYILWSNIMNDFSDSEIKSLDSFWKPVKKIENGGVCLILYQNPNLELCEN